MIQFSKTTLGIEEKEAVAKVIDSGWVVLGSVTEEFEQRFAEYVGATYAVSVDSCTSAMGLALEFLKRGGLHSVIVPSLTFTATAEAVFNADLNLTFGDIRRDTFCLKEVYENSLPVHFGGVRAEWGSKIYDSAHRIERDDVKGSDALWCYSFYATKNMTTVNGGMIATNSKEAYEWLRLARAHGLDLGTKERYKGKYAQYDVTFVGWRENIDDLRSAVGIEQLKKLPRNTQRRNEIVSIYNRAFMKTWLGNHLYPVLVKDQKLFMDYMYENDVQTSIHYFPLHRMTAWKGMQKDGDLKNTDYVGSHIVSLPLYPQLTTDEVTHIIKTAMSSKLLI